MKRLVLIIILVALVATFVPFPTNSAEAGGIREKHEWVDFDRIIRNVRMITAMYQLGNIRTEIRYSETVPEEPETEMWKPIR